MNNAKLIPFNKTHPGIKSKPILPYGLALVTVLLTNSSTLAKVEKTKAAPGKTEKASVSKKIEDLPNFHQVHPFLYRSGEPTRKGLDDLKEMGVATIIDLRSSGEKDFDEKAEAEKLGLTYISLVMSDKAPTDKQVETLLSTLDKAKETEKPVLVHCAHGSDRTGCMVGIWRVARDGWNFEPTYKEMRKYYFGPKYLNLKNAVKQRVVESAQDSK
ncbi:MAG: tyrosine-protein phosphatase [Candidatus Obscuribacterales bacterium]|nr:tyrosine-protein phosphatase [Candidatus Obscuribacterales bacterium]